MFVTLDNGTKIECEDTPFAEGGEGKIYWDRAGTHVIKLYKDVEASREAIIREIVGPRFSVVFGEPFWEKYFAWPDAIIKQPGLGITMPRRKGTDMLWFLQPGARKAYAAKNGPEKLGKWINYVRVSLKMSQLVGRMHNRGLCHSDLSFKNFMCDPANDSVALLDCDSLVVPLMAPPNVLGTKMCMAPELMTYYLGGAAATPTRETDRHALATLIYWLLLQRHPLIGPKQHDTDADVSEALALGPRALFIEDPNDRSNNFPKLPPTFAYTAFLTPAVADLVTQAFVDGLHNPDKRPGAAHWSQALHRMEDAIIPCDNPKCPAGSFVVHPGQGAVKCVCGQGVTSVAVLPILNFYTQRRAGHFISDQGYIMVAWPGRVLQKWHVYTDTPEIEPDQSPKCRLDYDPTTKKWYLVNVDLTNLVVLDNQQGPIPLPPGQKTELKADMRILFGPPPQFRMAYVQMQKVA